MMQTEKRGGTFQPDSDIHIAYQDQQQINRFARLNAKNETRKEELKTLDKAIRLVEEAIEEIELADDDEKIPYMVGEVFLYQTKAQTEESLASEKTKLQEEMKTLQEDTDKLKEEMSELKKVLYGKFGSNINLDE